MSPRGNINPRVSLAICDVWGGNGAADKLLELWRTTRGILYGLHPFFVSMGNLNERKVS
jgi:hypothetical protein